MDPRPRDSSARLPFVSPRPRRRPRALVGLVSALAVALSVVGCAAPDDWRVAARLIDEDPELLELGELTIRETVVEWPTDVDDGGWRIGPDDGTLSFAGRGLTVRSARGFVWLERAVDLDADEIDVITLGTRGNKRSPVTLEWAGPDQDFTNARRIKAFRNAEGTRGENLYRLALRGEAAWTGRITRLRFGLRVADDRVLVVEPGAGRESVAPDALAGALARPWRVTLDNETRNVWLSLPGLEVERDVTPSPRAQVRFAYGVDPQADQPFTFRVEAVDEQNEATSLFEAEVAPGHGGWHEGRADLGAFAGRDVRLRFAMTTPNEHDPLLGFGYWAHPEVVAPAADDEPTRPPNVLLISIDTLRADHLSVYGYDRPTSPRLEAWAAERATVFETAVAPSPWTLPSHISMLTGLDAVHHGVNHARPMPRHLHSLAETLRSAGRATGAVTAGGYVHPLYGLAQGFDRFRFFAVNMGHREELAHGMGYALDWLERHRDRPFFFFFHTYEVHMPFTPRQPWFEQFSDLDPTLELGGREPKPQAEDGYLAHKSWFVKRGDEVVAPDGVPEAYASLPDDLYDAGIAYTDDQIGKLLDALETLGIADDTIVVITSDHGDMLGEHGAHNHLYVYDENLLIPLLIADPAGRGAGRRVPQQVRTVDIVPTVLDLAGLRQPTSLDGVSLVPLLEGRPVAVPPAWSYASASNWGLSLRMQDRLKYVFKNAVWGSEIIPPDELFDLERGEGSSIEADAERLAPFRAQAARLFDDHLPGLRVRIENRGTRVLRGVLSGTPIDATRVKRASVDDCECFTLYGGRRMAFAVPPKSGVTVALEDVPAAPLGISIGGGNGKSYRTEIETPTIGDEGFSIRRVDGAWHEVAGQDGFDHGIAIWWQGDAVTAAAAPEDDNAALREQLEALGYIGN